MLSNYWRSVNIFLIVYHKIILLYKSNMNTTDNKLPDISDIRRENLRALEKEAGGRKTLSEAMDIQYSQLTNVLSTNYSRNIGSSMARKAEKAMGKPEGWLDQPQKTLSTDISIKQVRGIHTIPLFTWAQISLFVDTGLKYAQVERLIATPNEYSTDAFALIMNNESMIDKDPAKSIPKGAEMIIEPNAQTESEDIVLIIDTQTKNAAIKRYVSDGLTSKAVSTNEHIEPIDLSNDRYKIIGTIKEAIHRITF